MGRDLKLARAKVKTDLRSYNFTETVADACNRLPEKVVSRSTVSGFRHIQDKRKIKK